MHGGRGGKLGMKNAQFEHFDTFVEGTNGRNQGNKWCNMKDSNRHIRMLSAENKNPHASLLESTPLKETKEFWGTMAQH